MQQSLHRDLIHGSHVNAYEMDGLESIIKTGYTDDDDQACCQLDSILVDWLHDGLDGEVNDLGNIFDYLDEIVNDIEYRASQLGPIAETDMIILTSRFMATCLLDAYACYSTCGVTDIGDVTDQALRAQQRQARFDLNGGPLYDGATAVGFINLKSGRRLPIMVEDSLDVSRPVDEKYCTDLYILTRKVGSIDCLYGEYLDLREVENRAKKMSNNYSARADAAGRFLTKALEEAFCIRFAMGTSPELYLSMPWAQVRISNVCCARKRRPIVGDPFQPHYLPGGVDDGCYLYEAEAFPAFDAAQ